MSHRRQKKYGPAPKIFDDGLFSIGGAADFLHIEKSTLVELINLGLIPHVPVKTGSRNTDRRLRPAALVAFAKEHLQ